MVQVATDVFAHDACDASPTLTVTVSSNEAQDGGGDGSTSPDWEVVSNADGTYDVYVRAERSGNGSGRVYTITAASTDKAGNTTSTYRTVTVPKNGADLKLPLAKKKSPADRS